MSFAPPSRLVQGKTALLGGQCMSSTRGRGAKQPQCTRGFQYHPVPLPTPPDWFLFLFVVQEIPEKDFVLVIFPFPSADIDCSLTEISGHHYLPSANLSALHYTDIRLPAWSVKCSSLQEYSRENKISNLLSSINFREDWSCGTQCENSNLTLGWTLAEYQV